MNLTIRNVPDDAIARIDAMLNGQPRESYLRDLIIQISKAPELSQPQWGQGFKVIAPGGGSGTLRSLETSVSGGCTNFTQKQFDAFQKAKLLIDIRNGSRWEEAKKILEDAGLEVFWV